MDISALEGQELASVTFVRDYLQLSFDGPWLTLYHWPEVFRSEGSYAFGEPEYRDILCAQIGESVSKTSLVTGVALEIEFENGVIFRSSLRDEDYEGPEAGQFSTGNPGDPLLVF
jgi:hypothetical protein